MWRLGTPILANDISPFKKTTSPTIRRQWLTLSSTADTKTGFIQYPCLNLPDRGALTDQRALEMELPDREITPQPNLPGNPQGAEPQRAQSGGHTMMSKSHGDTTSCATRACPMKKTQSRSQWDQQQWQKPELLHPQKNNLATREPCSNEWTNPWCLHRPKSSPIWQRSPTNEADDYSSLRENSCEHE